MNIEFSDNFYNLDCYENLETPLIKHITFKELKNDLLIKNLFREFGEKVLNEEDIWGRNKLSNDLNSITNYNHSDIIQKIYNFNTFQDHKFKHYHLVSADRRTDNNIGKISDTKNNQNTCGTLIHYQLLENKIIIHSIAKHESGEWDELFNLINPNYCELITCQECGTNFTTYKDMSCPCCASNPNFSNLKTTNTLMKIKEKFMIGDSAIATVIKACDIQKYKEQQKSNNAFNSIMITAILFKKNINLNNNKLISSIAELNQELDR